MEDASFPQGGQLGGVGPTGPTRLLVVEHPDVLVVAAPGETQDAVLAAAAAQELTARTVGSVGELTEHWREAGAVFIADEFAAEVAGRALPRRDGVYLAGSDEALLAAWSAPLGARVIGLPAGRAWLGVVLGGGGPGAVRTPVIAVIGGSGGAGASTLATTLACLSARRDRAAALVDVDPIGGGIDLLLGAEQAEGWRWPRLSGADGYVGDLRAYLPVVDGVSLVSMSRGPAIDLARDPLAAILGSLRRAHRLVVLDVGRTFAAAAGEALRLATRVLVVARGSVRSVAATRELIRARQLDTAEVVLRSGAVGAAEVADALESPVVAELPRDRRLAVAAERGLSPLRAGRRYRAACSRLLAHLEEAGDD